MKEQCKEMVINPSELKIDQISITPIAPRGSLLAFVSFTFHFKSFSFFCGNIGLHSCLSNRRYRLVFPDRTLPFNGVKIHSFKPINETTREVIETKVTEKFEKFLKEKVEEHKNGNSHNSYKP